MARRVQWEDVDPSELTELLPRSLHPVLTPITWSYWDRRDGSVEWLVRGPKGLQGCVIVQEKDGTRALVRLHAVAWRSRDYDVALYRTGVRREA